MNERRARFERAKRASEPARRTLLAWAMRRRVVRVCRSALQPMWAPGEGGQTFEGFVLCAVGVRARRCFPSPGQAGCANRPWNWCLCRIRPRTRVDRPDIAGVGSAIPTSSESIDRADRHRNARSNRARRWFNADTAVCGGKVLQCAAPRGILASARHRVCDRMDCHRGDGRVMSPLAPWRTRSHPRVKHGSGCGLRHTRTGRAEGAPCRGCAPAFGGEGGVALARLERTADWSSEPLLENRLPSLPE